MPYGPMYPYVRIPNLRTVRYVPNLRAHMPYGPMYPSVRYLRTGPYLPFGTYGTCRTYRTYVKDFY